jgi:hypothetical protein
MDKSGCGKTDDGFGSIEQAATGRLFDGIRPAPAQAGDAHRWAASIIVNADPIRSGSASPAWPVDLRDRVPAGRGAYRRALELGAWGFDSKSGRLTGLSCHQGHIADLLCRPLARQGRT